MSYKVRVYPEPGAELPGESVCPEWFSTPVCPLCDDTYYIRSCHLGEVFLSVHTVTSDLQQSAEVVDNAVEANIVPYIEEYDVSAAYLSEDILRWGRDDYIVLACLEIGGHASTLDHHFDRSVLLPDNPLNLCKWDMLGCFFHRVIYFEPANIELIYLYLHK